MPKFLSTKTYNTSTGLSCCFRQWRAKHSHCQLLHGYALGVKLTFECTELDERNGVMDFGGLKELKQWLHHMFDHTTVIALDDPKLQTFRELYNMGVLELRTVPGVGCEMFAKLIYERMNEILAKLALERKLLNTTVQVKSVEVFEHGANSAIYEG